MGAAHALVLVLCLPTGCIRLGLHGIGSFLHDAGRFRGHLRRIGRSNCAFHCGQPGFQVIQRILQQAAITGNVPKGVGGQIAGDTALCSP